MQDLFVEGRESVALGGGGVKIRLQSGRLAVAIRVRVDAGQDFGQRTVIVHGDDVAVHILGYVLPNCAPVRGHDP